MSESFAFCSSIFVLLTRRLCHQRARLCPNQRLTREFTLLEICMIYHQAEQVSQCVWTAVVKGAQHPLIGRLCTLSTCLRHGGRFRLARIIGHPVRERFVGSRAAPSSEIRWLNVKQPTSTRSGSTRLDHDQDRTGLIDVVDSDSDSIQLERDLSRGELSLVSHGSWLDWTLESVVSSR